jgi:hypothetical protein
MLGEIPGAHGIMNKPGIMAEEVTTLHIPLPEQIYTVLFILLLKNGATMAHGPPFMDENQVDPGPGTPLPMEIGDSKWDLQIKRVAFMQHGDHWEIQENTATVQVGVT